MRMLHNYIVMECECKHDKVVTTEEGEEVCIVCGMVLDDSRETIEYAEKYEPNYYFHALGTSLTKKEKQKILKHKVTKEVEDASIINNICRGKLMLNAQTEATVTSIYNKLAKYARGKADIITVAVLVACYKHSIKLRLTLRELYDIVCINAETNSVPDINRLYKLLCIYNYLSRANIPSSIFFTNAIDNEIPPIYYKVRR